MDAFAKFLGDLLHEGGVVFRERPEPSEAANGQAAQVLSGAFDRYRLDVPGPALPFKADVALATAELVRQACWAVVSRGERVADLERRLDCRRLPRSAADHLSGDLTLRFLPQVYRRARAMDSSDPLVAMLAKIQRDWPLSGVLANLDEGPSHPEALDFGGHPGLMLLYAERLAELDRPEWRPPRGRPMEYFELVAPGLARASLASDGFDDRGEGLDDA